MTRVRTRWRAGLALAGVTCAFLTHVAWREARAIDEAASGRERARLDGAIDALHDLGERELIRDEPGELALPVEHLARGAVLELALLDADGVAVAAAPTPAFMNRRQAGYAEVALARATMAEARHVRPGGPHGEPTLYVARPIHSHGLLVGFARAGIPVARIEATRSALLRLLAGISGLALVSAFGLAALARHRLAAPLRQMAAVAERMADGGEPSTPFTTRADELGVLARALAGMAGRLRERLEGIDAERTQLLAVLGGMVEGVIAVDRDDRVLHINKVAAQLLGVTASTSLGKPVWEVTRIPAIIEALGTASFDAPAREVQIATPERAYRLWIYSAPLRNASRKNMGAVVVLHDVTELRRLENLRREFVANVSHELKTPVAAISGMTDTMLDDEAMPAERARRFLQKIREQADRLAKLINDLLALSRLESADLEQLLPFARLDLRDPISASVEHARPVAQVKGLAFSIALPDEPVWVHGDDESLRQLADNLLSNAINYTPAGGSISLTLTRDGDHALLVVRDTGIGIDPVHHHRIFERFYRTDKARSRAQGGTGLGLAIVKHVALSHGGHVALESAVDQGSSFRVLLPLEGASAAPR